MNAWSGFTPVSALLSLQIVCMDTVFVALPVTANEALKWPSSGPLLMQISCCWCQCIHNFITCRVSTQGRCRVWLWLIEFSGVALSCFTLSRLTVFPDVLSVQPEDSLNPLFKAILYSVSWVRKLCIIRNGLVIRYQRGDDLWADM